MLNINYGHNKELMERCRKLEEYAFFVDQVRKLRTQGLSLETAADEAIRISLEQGVLTEILRKNRAEVKDLSIIASISVCRKLGLNDDQITQTLMENFSLSEVEARKYLKEQTQLNNQI